MNRFRLSAITMHDYFYLDRLKQDETNYKYFTSILIYSTLGENLEMNYYYKYLSIFCFNCV